MRILIAGAGRAGLSVAGYLTSAGHLVTVIDRDPLVCARAKDQLGIVALVGDAADSAILTEAEVSHAEAVVAMLHRDADNLAVASLAKLAHVPRVMVRMRDPEYRQVYLAAGVTRILSETEIFIGSLAAAIEHEAVLHAMLLGNGEAVAFEIVIPSTSRVVGRTVSEIAALPEFPKSCVFAGIYTREGAVIGPRGASVIEGGMTVLIVSLRSEIRQTLALLIEQ
ncbi:MAG TPA: TrkA family potassium uptake protein [Polyangiaceae bacterium]|nr:TrkA family potassium uptake protein [Polyangiaceae bacterium]